jgi:hypothetical protein
MGQPGTPVVRTTDRITRGHPVETVIVFSDCQAAPDGNCNVSVHYEMNRPDGSPYEKPLRGIAWNHPPLPGHALMPSEVSMGFRLDPPDKLGRYVITATLKDNVSGKELSLRQAIFAVEEMPQPQPPT